jgi:hypothetical protein
MARTLSIQDALAANESVFNNNDLANHPFNSFADPAMVSIYAAATAADIEILAFQLGDQIHSQNFRLPIAAAVSMRDHLVAQGVILPGQRMALSYRNTGAGTPTLNANIVIEELPED